MKPSQLVTRLRQIAAEVEASKKPSKQLVAKDIKQLIATLSGPQKIYRVITDSPMGVAVGFKPSDESLGKMNAEVDSEWDLVSDDGSDDGHVLFTGDKHGSVMIREQYPTQEELNAGIIPLGPDLHIFRSQQEFDDYVSEWLGEE